MKLFSSLKNSFRAYLIAGTAVMVPLIGTFLILKFIIVSTDDLFISLLPQNWEPEKLWGIKIPGVGLVATLMLVIIVGAVTKFYFGRWIVSIGDSIIAKIPLGRGIYMGIKKFVETVLSSNSKKFRAVVAVEFARRGCWTIGFVTGEYEMGLNGHPENMLSVFIPTTPNPTSGYLVYVPVRDAKLLPMGVDEALKLIISGGIVHEPTLDSEPKAV